MVDMHRPPSLRSDPVASEGAKLRPRPSIDPGPLGRLSFVGSTPLASASNGNAVSPAITSQLTSRILSFRPSIGILRQQFTGRCGKSASLRRIPNKIF
jgi:hypothetical protein